MYSQNVLSLGYELFINFFLSAVCVKTKELLVLSYLKMGYQVFKIQSHHFSNSTRQIFSS